MKYHHWLVLKKKEEKNPYLVNKFVYESTSSPFKNLEEIYATMDRPPFLLTSRFIFTVHRDVFNKQASKQANKQACVTRPCRDTSSKRPTSYLRPIIRGWDQSIAL